jgi:hypothetical protein
MALTALASTQDDFPIAVQRRYDPHLSMVVLVEANNVLGAAGAGARQLVDGLRDKQAKEHSRRHNDILKRGYDVLRAIAHGQLVLGNKEDPAKTALFNIGYHVDIAHACGGHDGSDELYEVKCSTHLSGPPVAGWNRIEQMWGPARYGWAPLRIRLDRGNAAGPGLWL